MIRRNKHRGTEATEQGQGESKEKQNTQGQVFRQRKGTKSTDKKKKGPKICQHERHARTPGRDERKPSVTRHNNDTTTTPTHELRGKRYSKFLNHPTHPTLEYRLPSNYARRALLVRSMNHNGGQGTLRILQGRLQPCYRKRASLALLLAVQRWNYRCYLTILVTKVPKIDSEP